MSAEALTIRAVKASSRLRLVEPVARLLSRRIAVAREPDDARYRVLYLDKLGLAEDLGASLGRDERFALLSLDRASLKAVARAFLPDSITDNSYTLATAGIAEAKAAYRAFLAAVLQRLARWHRLDAVMSANFAYVAERELQAAAEQIGLPFLVMQKENLKTPGNFPFFETVYRELRGPFRGRGLLVYNDIERELEVTAGVARPDQLTVTGMPRLDRLHAWRTNGDKKIRNERPTVLFFFFSEKTGLPFDTQFGPSIYADRGGPVDATLRALAWDELRRETVAAIVRLARNNPDLDVVIKGKVDHLKGNQMADAIDGQGGAPANLRLVGGGDPVDLIQQADVVCGFVSTALLEALAAGKPVVQPCFAEATRAPYSNHLLDLGDASINADSPARLVATLADLARSRPEVAAELTPAAKTALEHWTGNSDGKAGTRVAAAVAAAIENARIPQPKARVIR